MNRNAAFKSEVDWSGNTLNVRFVGLVGLAEMQACGEKFESLLAKTRPGFQLLTDLSNLESMEISCAPYLCRVMEGCRVKGVKKIVRIIPNPAKDIGFNILSYFHYRRGIRVVTCATRAEAELELMSRAENTGSKAVAPLLRESRGEPA